MVETISQILEIKGREVWNIHPDAKIYDALVVMADKHVGALVVIEEEHVIGIFSERDFAFKVDLCGLSAKTATVRQAMTEDVCFVTPETSVEEAMAVVTESRCRHLPVMQGELLVGLASIGDLVKASLDEKDFVIKQLQKYIKGAP
jgi:CBS domain-containing protein